MSVSLSQNFLAKESEFFVIFSKKSTTPQLLVKFDTEMAKIDSTAHFLSKNVFCFLFIGLIISYFILNTWHNHDNNNVHINSCLQNMIINHSRPVSSSYLKLGCKLTKMLAFPTFDSLKELTLPRFFTYEIWSSLEHHKKYCNSPYIQYHALMNDWMYGGDLNKQCVDITYIYYENLGLGMSALCYVVCTRIEQ